MRSTLAVLPDCLYREIVLYWTGCIRRCRLSTAIPVQRGGSMAKKQPQLSVRSDSTTQWFRITSGVVGGILLGLAGLWLAWLLLHQFAGNTIPAPPAPPIISAFPTSPTDSQIASLTAEGITLGHPSQTPALNQQQALLLASQLEPGAASKSKTAGAHYVLLSYPDKSTPAAHPN